MTRITTTKVWISQHIKRERRYRPPRGSKIRPGLPSRVSLLLLATPASGVLPALSFFYVARLFVCRLIWLQVLSLPLRRASLFLCWLQSDPLIPDPAIPDIRYTGRAEKAPASQSYLAIANLNFGGFVITETMFHMSVIARVDCIYQVRCPLSFSPPRVSFLTKSL